MRLEIARFDMTDLYSRDPQFLLDSSCDRKEDIANALFAWLYAKQCKGPVAMDGLRFRSLCQTLAAFTLSAQLTMSAQPASEHTQESRANRLAGESSPYLLLHAHNPVDWYPWGDEARAKAKRENKPIFLSIGYSSCYWCHVMERLVFSNAAIAKYMNEHFVNVKVDREERPDIDDIYMTSLIVYFQAVGSPQGGGWPLSMFLTPEGKPFAGGTYFPPDDDGPRLGFGSVARRVNSLWEEREAQIRNNADIITSEVRRAMKPQIVGDTAEPTREAFDRIVKDVLASYDADYGGFGFNPSNADTAKFPVPSRLGLMLHAAERSGDKDVRDAVFATLDRIAAGGIRDHLGGGFHRYSTDRKWHVPHFEKMLYDQAQLAFIYAQAWKITHKPAYRAAAENVLDYVLSGLTDQRGGFYSALDAETDEVEGRYYVWEAEEVRRVLGADADAFMQAYGMREPNPFEHGFVLHLPRSLAETAKQLETDETELSTTLAVARKRLLETRSDRELPLRDDKVLTSWNGLMIRAFAYGGFVFDRDDYVQVASRAADFLLAELCDDSGRMLRTWRNGSAKLNAYLDDYAFTVEGLLALHDATEDERWLSSARTLTDLQIEHYWSKDAKGFFFTPADHEDLIVRTRNAFDNVLPSGNSVTVRNLLRLAERTGEAKYREYARETLTVFGSAMKSNSLGVTNMAVALSEYLDGMSGAATGDDGTSIMHPQAGQIQLTSYQVPSTSRSSTEARKKKEYVRARAYLSVDRLPAGRRCHVVLILDIADGWHINANPAKPDFLEPTRFSLRSANGTKLVNIQYPKSVELDVDGFPEKFMVYEKRAIIRGMLETPEAIAGRVENLELVVDYQACNSTKCLRPAKVVLGGKVPVAHNLDEVRLINANLFPSLKRGGTVRR